jgi:hypothetical protein
LLLFLAEEHIGTVQDDSSVPMPMLLANQLVRLMGQEPAPGSIFACFFKKDAEEKVAAKPAEDDAWSGFMHLLTCGGLFRSSDADEKPEKHVDAKADKHSDIPSKVVPTSKKQAAANSKRHK